MMKFLESLNRTVARFEGLGSRTLESGVRLIGNVPHVAPEAYFHVIFPPLDDASIGALEDRIGTSVPSWLREFYQLANGIKLFAYHLYVAGHRTSNVRMGDAAWQPFALELDNNKERPDGTPDDLVVFGGYQQDCSVVAAAQADPRVFHSPTDRFAPGREWASIDDWLCREISRLDALFDETGRLIGSPAELLP